jgi:DNA-binding response OmpR family regulator
MKVLLLHREQDEIAAITQALHENQYTIEQTGDAHEALEMLQANTYDIILTEIILSGYMGIEFCKMIRKRGVITPIIIITSFGMTHDKVEGFDAGADDYLVKPFAMEELLARMKALLKRSRGEVAGRNELRFADLLLDLDARQLFRAGQPIEMNNRELSMVEYFMRNKERIVTREELQTKILEFKFDTGTNVVGVYLSQIRSKMERVVPERIIITKQGVGYMMTTRFSKPANKKK